MVLTTLKRRRESIKPGSIEETYIEGSPTVPYPCFQAPICHLLPENRQTCCLNLFKECEHDKRTCAAEYDFKNPLTILSVESTSVSVISSEFCILYKYSARKFKFLEPERLINLCFEKISLMKIETFEK